MEKKVNVLEFTNGMTLYEGEDITIIKVPKKRKRFTPKPIRRFLYKRIGYMHSRMWRSQLLFTGNDSFWCMFTEYRKYLGWYRKWIIKQKEVI